jgi:dihydrofolate reductase
MGVPVFVVTHTVPAEWVKAHPDVHFTFVTEGGVLSAVRQAKANAGVMCVVIGPGQVAVEALDAGLLDEGRIDLVPVLFGAGKPLFGNLGKVPVAFGTPQVIEGKGVTHLIHRLTPG